MTASTLTGVGAFTIETDRDQTVWHRLCAFVDSEPRAFTRDPHVGGHVTGSAFVLSPDGRSVLLAHHRKLDMWLQLGGHCDGVADATFVATREAYEESGLARIALVSADVLDVDIHDIPEIGSDPAHLHYDVRYLFRAEAGEILVSDESHALEWVPLRGIEARTTETSILRMRDKALRWLKS